MAARPAPRGGVRGARAGAVPTADDSLFGVRRAAEREADSFLRHVRAGAFGNRGDDTERGTDRSLAEEGDRDDAADVELPSAVQFVAGMPDGEGEEFDGVSFHDAEEYLAEHGGPQSTSFADMVEAETPSPPPAPYPKLPTTQSEIVVPPTPTLPLETPGAYFAQKTEELGRTPWGPLGREGAGAHPAFALSRLRGGSGRRPELQGGAAADDEEELCDDEATRQKFAQILEMDPTSPLSRPDSPPPAYTPKGTEFDTPTLRRLQAKHAMREARRIGVRLEASKPKAGEAGPRMSLFLRQGDLPSSSPRQVPGEVPEEAARAVEKDGGDYGDVRLGDDSEEEEEESDSIVDDMDRLVDECSPPRLQKPPAKFHLPTPDVPKRSAPVAELPARNDVGVSASPRFRREDRHGFYLSTTKVAFSPTLVHTSKLEHVRLCNGSADDIAVFASVSPISAPAPKPSAAAATCECGRDPSRPFMVTARPVLIKARCYVLFPVRFRPHRTGSVQMALTVVPHLVSSQSAESSRLSLSALQPVRIVVTGVGCSVPVIVEAKALHFSSADRVEQVRIQNVGPSDVGWSASLPGDGLTRDASPLSFPKSGIVKAESHFDLRIEYHPGTLPPRVLPSAIHISFLSHHARLPVLIDS